MAMVEPHNVATQEGRRALREGLVGIAEVRLDPEVLLALLDRLDEIDPPPGQDGEYEKVLAAVRQKMNDLNLNRCQLDDGIACVEKAIQALADIVEGILQANGKRAEERAE